jgi:hypothetical protein
VNQSTGYLYSIEYPYEISKTLSKPAGFSIGSNAIGISLFKDTNSIDEVNIITAFDPYVINSVEHTNKSAESLLHKWDISCGCYNGETRRYDKSVCGKVTESDGMLSCPCNSGYSPCYLVYKFPTWETLAIVLPIIISLTIAILAVTILLLLLYRARNNSHPVVQEQKNKTEMEKTIEFK